MLFERDRARLHFGYKLASSRIKSISASDLVSGTGMGSTPAGRRLACSGTCIGWSENIKNQGSTERHAKPLSLTMRLSRAAKLGPSSLCSGWTSERLSGPAAHMPKAPSADFGLKKVPCRHGTGETARVTTQEDLARRLQKTTTVRTWAPSRRPSAFSRETTRAIHMDSTGTGTGRRVSHFPAGRSRPGQRWGCRMKGLLDEFTDRPLNALR